MNPNLTVAVRLFFSNTFTTRTFPYKKALKAWRDAAQKRGRYHKQTTGSGKAGQKHMPAYCNPAIMLCTQPGSTQACKTASL
eukprot:2761-Chlamydomonas_euryale.AAC.1